MDTPPAVAERFAAGAIDGLSEYRITAPAEVARLLGALRDGGVLLKLAAPGGAAFGTRLRTVDAPRRLLGLAADAGDPRLPPLLAAERVVAACVLDGIQLQFEVNGLLLVHGVAGCTLRCSWPAALWRLQRRGGYRVRSLPSNAPHAVLRHPVLADVRLALRVLDLSAGGCALLLPDEVPGIEPGLRIDAVQLQLDAGTRVDVGLLLRRIGGNGPGSRGLRLGCEWARLAAAGERTLQRWIDQTQRRRPLGR